MIFLIELLQRETPIYVHSKFLEKEINSNTYFQANPYSYPI